MKGGGAGRRSAHFNSKEHIHAHGSHGHAHGKHGKGPGMGHSPTHMGHSPSEAMHSLGGMLHRVEHAAASALHSAGHIVHAAEHTVEHEAELVYHGEDYVTKHGAPGNVDPDSPLRPESPVGPPPGVNAVKYHIQTYGVPMGVYTTWIKEELEKEAACLELPLTIMLLLCFTVMALLHLRQAWAGMIENAISDDITENANFAWAHHFGHKGIEDVNSFADFWSWTRLGFLPLLTMTWPYSEDLSLAEPRFSNYSTDALPSHRHFVDHEKKVPARNDYLRYNRIIGAVRMRQQVAFASEDKCTFPRQTEVFKKWFGKPCSPAAGGELPPDLQEAEDFANSAREEWLVLETNDHPAQVLVDMEDGCSSAIAQNRTCLCKWCADQNPPVPWLTEDTLRVELSFIILNPQHGLYSYASVNFWFNRAGHIQKLINMRSAWIGVFARSLDMNFLLVFADVSWLLLNVYVLFNEVREVSSIVGKSHKVWYKAFFEDYMEFWNVIDWTSIILFSTIVFFGLRLESDTQITNARLADTAMDMVSGNTNESQVLSHVISFYAAVEEMLSSEAAFRQQLVFYPTVLMLRLFKSFAAQPRLAIITETFVEAQSDIFHFFIVFFSVYFCMAVNGVLFFGQDMVDFATIDRAFHACFLSMFGDWDYEGMEGVGRVKASIWFWLFMVIVVLILQNIMLAILMEAYTCVKEASKDSISLGSQIQKQYRRWRQARLGQRVRLNDIFDALLDLEGDEEEMLQSEKAVLPHELVKIVPHLKDEQALRTLTDSHKDWEKQNTEPFGVAKMAPNMASSKERLQTTVLCSAFMEARMGIYDKVERPAGTFDDDETPDYNRSKTVENTGTNSPIKAPKGRHVEGGDAKSRETAAKHHDDDQIHRKGQLEEGLEKVRKIAQHHAHDLQEAMEAVLEEEMQALERRQKEQQQSMQQMQASLQSLRMIAYKLSDTCTLVADISPGLAPDMPLPEEDTAPTAPLIQQDQLAITQG